MSETMYTLMWKGVKSGPYTREQLEAEFVEGRLGLVRTVICGNMTMSGAEFVNDLVVKKREEELEEELHYQEQQAEVARDQLKKLEEDHKIALEELTKAPAARTTPPPIPDRNPWALGGDLEVEASLVPLKSSYSDKYLIVASSILSVICLMAGHGFRECSGLIAIILGVVLLFRKQFTAGLILIAASILCLFLGLQLTDLVHDYLLKNYPN